jgi:hypothetical protein
MYYINILRNCVVSSPSSCAVSCERLHNFRSAAGGMTVQSLGDLHSLAPYVDVILPVSLRRCSNCGKLRRLDDDRIPMQQYQLDCYTGTDGYGHSSFLSMP